MNLLQEQPAFFIFPRGKWKYAERFGCTGVVWVDVGRAAVLHRIKCWYGVEGSSENKSHSKEQEGRRGEKKKRQSDIHRVAYLRNSRPTVQPMSQLNALLQLTKCLWPAGTSGVDALVLAAKSKEFDKFNNFREVAYRDCQGEYGGVGVVIRKSLGTPNGPCEFHPVTPTNRSTLVQTDKPGHEF